MMVEAQSGAFYAFVPKSPGFLSSLLHGCKSEEIVHARLDPVFARYSEAYQAARRDLNAGQPLTSVEAGGTPGSQQVQKYVLGGGGITVQPGLQKITDCLVRVTPYVHHSKEHIVVFFGALSNLDDLLRRGQEFQRGSSSLPLGRSAGAGARTGELLLMLYKRFGDGQELILLSELQGSYAFVVYDNVRKQAFAARDASGSQPLFYRIDGDGSVSFTNSLAQLPGGGGERSSDAGWCELPPGHFMSGKHLTQFALTPKQLATRERNESLDADALGVMLRREQEAEHEADEGRGAGSVFISPVRSLLKHSLRRDTPQAVERDDDYDGVS